MTQRELELLALLQVVNDQKKLLPAVYRYLSLILDRYWYSTQRERAPLLRACEGCLSLHRFGGCAAPVT